MKHIILDTNFILIPAQFNVDIFDELHRISDFKYDISVLDETIKELEKITVTQRGKHREAAKLAKQIIKKHGIKIIKTTTNEYADDLLVRFSKKDYIVATQDIGLKHRLKKPYITLRKKQYLVLVK